MKGFKENSVSDEFILSFILDIMISKFLG